MNEVTVLRAVVVLDPSAAHLSEALRARNIRVIVPPQGVSLVDETSKQMLLSGRIVVTTNEEDFVSDASSYDYGIVSLRLLSQHSSGDVNERTAKLISTAFITYSLWTKRHGFVLVLHVDGRAHEYRDLID